MADTHWLVKELQNLEQMVTRHGTIYFNFEQDDIMEVEYRPTSPHDVATSVYLKLTPVRKEWVVDE